MKNNISLGKSTLNLLYQVNRTWRTYLDDSLKSRNGFYTYNSATYDALEHFSEAFLVYPFQAFKLTTGVDYRNAQTDYSAVQAHPFTPSPYSTEYSGDSIHHEQLGWYAALHYSGNAFSMEGGGRINTQSEYGSNFAFNLNPSYLIQKKNGRSF